MRPGADQEFLLGAGGFGHRVLAQTAEMSQPAAQKNIVPGRHVVHRNIDVAVLALQVDAPPVRPIFGMGQIIRDIAGHGLENIAPGHQRQLAIGGVRQGLGKRDMSGRQGAF